MHQKLNTNAAFVISHLGNGHLGLIYLTVTIAVSNTLCATELAPTGNPGPTAIIPPGATQTQI